MVVRYVLNWTEENIYTGAGIDSLVRDIRCSRKTLEVRFRSRYGLSPGAYLMRRRMSRAAMLLRMTSLPVTEIACLFHFYSSQNFGRAFKKFTGVTPVRYREQDEWQIQVLQQPFLAGGAERIHAELCEFPEFTLHGQTAVCEHDFLSLSDKENHLTRIKNSLRLHREKTDEEMCVACQVVPSVSLSSGRSAIIHVEMTVQDSGEHRAGDTVHIPAGQYMQFYFSGSLSEYVVFTRLIYFKFIETGQARRKGFDLIFFTFPPESHEEINCRHLIPC